MAVVGTAHIAITAIGEGQFEAKLVKDVKQAVAAAEKGAKIVPVADTSRATGPLDLLKQKMVSFGGASNPITRALGDVTTASGGAESALAGLSTGGLAIAGAAAVAFATKSVASFQEYAGGVRAVQRVTGASAEDASKLAAAFRAVGIAPEQAAPSLGRLARNLASNGEALGKLGIEIAKNKDGTTNMKETFLNVADAVAKAKDPTEALNLSMTAFGRSGQALLPILAKGREGITGLFEEAGAHGQLFSQKDLDTSKEMTMAFRRIKETITGVFIEAGKHIAPFIVNIAHIVEGVIALSQKFELVKNIIKVSLLIAFAPLIAIVKDVELLAKAVDFLTGKHREHKAAATADAAATGDDADVTNEMAGASSAAAKAADAATKAAEDHKRAISDLKGAITDVTTAQRAQKDAQKSVTDAQGAARDAQSKLTKLQADGVIDTKALASAQKGLADAEKAVVSAQDAVAASADKVQSATQARVDAVQRQSDAQAALNRLISGQAAAEDMVAHRHDLEHANLAVRQATKSLSDAEAKRTEVLQRQGVAEAKLAELRAGHTATAKDIQAAEDEVKKVGAAYAGDYADAQLAVDEATLALTESQDNLVTTQDDLNKIQNEGKTGSDKLAQAQRDLTLADKGVEQATKDLKGATKDQSDAADVLKVAQDGVVTKQGEVNAAMKPDPKLQADILGATKDVKDAWDKVAVAQFDASGKAADLATKQTALKDIAHQSLGDLTEVKNNLQSIVTLQPQAAAFLGPTLQAVNALIAAATATAQSQVLGWKPLPPGIAGPPTPITAADFTPLPAGIAGPPTPKRAAGGYSSGSSFYAGEDGIELVSLRPGGGAMVYAAGSPEARGSGGMPPVSIEIQAHFGPGTNGDDVIRGLRSIAQGEMTAALKSVLATINQGARR